MEFHIDTIEKDVSMLSEEEFVMKYIIKSPNWYFSTYLQNGQNETMDRIDTLNEIVAKGFDISFHSATMVGSAKVGFSLSPNKRFRPFIADEEPDKHVSDIDIAIISERLFSWAWIELRESKKYEFISNKNNTTMSREVFRGYINEKTLHVFSRTRRMWQEKAGPVTRELQGQLMILHPITYRIYRSWEDLEEYQIDCVKQLKQKQNAGG